MNILATKIFPAIDIIGGNCVRLTKGDYQSVKVYDSDPVEIARTFRAAGSEYLHVVDLDAAKNPDNNNRSLIAEIMKCGLKVQTGGGIRTEKDVDELLTIGANRLIIGSVAVTKRQEVEHWIKKYGAERIVIGADVKDRKIATHGWMQVSDESIDTFISGYMSAGAAIFLCTDISRDGMLSGSSIPLYRSLIKNHPGIGLIASGGVASMDEVHDLINMKMEGIIVGKAIYEGRIGVDELFNKL
jgi:phosphoribosylformimino-5-aminoimidazole carboxamide ribotide isomerase